MNEIFDKVIENSLKYKIEPSQIYTLPTGSDYLIINEVDKEIFNKLYPLAPDKGIGNGELAIYWLFKKDPNVVFRNFIEGNNADLIINDNFCEIKSYPDHNKKITIGKWKEDKDSRQLLNTLFAFHNISKENTHSEINFSLDDVTDSFNSLLEIKTELSKYYFYNDSFYKSIYNKTLNILSRISGSSPEELSRNLLIQIIKTKLTKKPDDGGYIINILPKDPTNIKVNRIDLKRLNNVDYDGLKNNVYIGSGELKISYKIFEQE